MWFRVEAYKDGSIKSCEQVSESFADGRNVLYIEADSKAAALQAAKERINRYLARRSDAYGKQKAKRASRIARGLCCECERPRVNKQHCEKHRSMEQARARRKRKLRAAGVGPKERTTDEVRYERDRDRDRSFRRRLPGNAPTLFARRAMLKRCLDVYRTDPGNFEAWILAQIESISVLLEPKEADAQAAE